MCGVAWRNLSVRKGDQEITAKCRPFLAFFQGGELIKMMGEQDG
jgi:hypothetical protein